MKRPENWEEIKMEHKSECNGNPSVYCGTYAKYNEGSLYGMWIDLTTFYDYDEFIDFCKMLHEDEHDPELMFQDYEGFPLEWYCESCMGEELFDKIVEYGNLNDTEQDMVNAYIEHVCGSEDIDTIKGKYKGFYATKEDFAWETLEMCYPDLPDFAKNYFNIEAFARDLFFDYDFADGYVFSNY